ncbi:MAG: glycosyltransferase family 4 protein [Bryobacterales bacterium]|nr:glycosyltransferase family 4 protein [Bryobacterales bacterium]
MRIGVNCFHLEPHIGGMKTYFAMLFERLLEHDGDNEYVFFHGARNEGELSKLRSERWRRDAVRLDAQEDVQRHWRGLDLYFCPFGSLWPRPAPLPSVVTVPDIQEEYFPEFFDAQQLYQRELHFPSSTRAADRVIAISGFTKQTIVDKHGVEPDKIVVAHLAADPVYFRAAELDATPENPPPFERYVFFPANRWLHKNHDLLLRALRLLRESRGLLVNAVFTGFDVERGYPLLEKAAEYGVRDQVHSVGYVTIEQIAGLYRKARMLVFPSLFEGFGLPALEAMAAGCPCVLAQTSSLPEIGGDAALYFDPASVEQAADAIAQVWTDDALRLSLIERGRRRVQSFSVSAMADAHLEAFRQAKASFRRTRYWRLRYFDEPRHRRRTERKYADALGQPEGLSSSPSLRVRFGEGWHALESNGAGWLRWSEGKGELILEADSAIDVVLEGEWMSIVRPNDVQVELNGETATTLQVKEGDEFQPWPADRLSLRKGRNTLRFSSRRKAIKSAQDPRRLAVAVKNLSVREEF